MLNSDFPSPLRDEHVTSPITRVPNVFKLNFLASLGLLLPCQADGGGGPKTLWDHHGLNEASLPKLP